MDGLKPQLGTALINGVEYEGLAVVRIGERELDFVVLPVALGTTADVQRIPIEDFTPTVTGTSLGQDQGEGFSIEHFLLGHPDE